jgi:hypothetical protein
MYGNNCYSNSLYSVGTSRVCGAIILLVSGLLVWFSKQSDKWQKFMFDIDEKWRAFNREQRETNQQSMNCVESSLKDLTTVTQGLVNEMREMRQDSKEFYERFHQHDAQAKEILHEVKNGKPAPKPRAKKPTDVPPAD